MKISTHLAGLATLLFGALASANSGGQTIQSGPDCQAIGGTWHAQSSGGRIGVCQLAQAYSIGPYETLRIGISADLQIVAGGHLVNDGNIDVPNTARLILTDGHFENNGTTTLDNRAELHYNGGDFTNTGDLHVEGDVYGNNRANRYATAERQCVRNLGGTMWFFSGGNLISSACINSARGGRLIIGPTATFILRDHGVYRGSGADQLEGRVYLHRGSFSAFSNLSIGQQAVVYNWSRMEAIGREFSVEGGARLMLEQGGEMVLSVQDWRVDGTVRLDSARVRVGLGLVDLVVGSQGEIRLAGASEAWPAGGPHTVQNNGLILRSCFSAWGATGQHVGNPVMNEPCFPVPIPPPLPSPFL